MARRAIVTGGTRGIGGAISRALKNAGYTVCAIYAGNDEAAKKFETETGIKTLKCNVANFNECAEGFKKAEGLLGGTCEVLVNNAGITRDGMMHKMTADQWNDVIDINLTGVFYSVKASLAALIESKGYIITISSLAVPITVSTLSETIGLVGSCGLETLAVFSIIVP